MWVKKLYIAEDGTEFSDERSCIEYEERQKESGYNCLEDYVVFYDYEGKRLPYSTVHISEYSAYYARVINVPEWSNNEEYSAWEKVMPSELDDKICSWGCGWYVSDGDGEWVSWEDMAQEYTQRNAVINKILCGGE